MGSFPAFLGVSIIIIVTPGPDTAITIRNTLFGGRAGGIMTALGIASGQTIWALAASIGIVALLIASEPLFLTIKYAGAAYLFYLGIQALREAVWPSAGDRIIATAPNVARRLKPGSAFRQGVLSDLSNPKMAVFFGSLLPQFVSSVEATFSAFILLGLIFAVMTFAWLALYAAFVSKIGDFLRRPTIRRGIEGLTGMTLIGMGVRVASERS